jgi:hypothetical protein
MPYHRLWNPFTQDSKTAQLQVSTGSIWGDVPKNGGAFKCVQAYRGGLDPRDMGIEFVTHVPPTAGTGTPWEARWIYCDHGVTKCSPLVWMNSQGYAVLPVTVTKVVP